MKKLSETLTELGIAFSFPIKINDANGNETYYENSKGFWQRYERVHNSPVGHTHYTTIYTDIHYD